MREKNILYYFRYIKKEKINNINTSFISISSIIRIAFKILLLAVQISLRGEPISFSWHCTRVPSIRSRGASCACSHRLRAAGRKCMRICRHRCPYISRTFHGFEPYCKFHPGSRATRLTRVINFGSLGWSAVKKIMRQIITNEGETKMNSMHIRMYTTCHGEAQSCKNNNNDYRDAWHAFSLYFPT